jgi:glycerophosphoryl diester phosphodiesterase
MRNFLPVIILLAMVSCTQNQSSESFDLQGHRGARGLLPENTIPGFLKATEFHVTTMEMDLVVTGENELLVSHEPWFNYKISTHPDGSPVAEDEQMSLNIYEMTYEQIQQYDVGMRGHPDFPEQKSMKVSKPLFKDAIRAIEEHVTEHNLEPLYYNIETKSEPEYYGIFVPQPSEFAQILFEELTELDQEFKILNRVTVQSFDPATLMAFRELDPEVSQAMLVYENNPVQSYIDTLGYTPEIWSPNYNLLTAEAVRDLHNRNMKVIPWTVNTVNEMRLLLQMGVDGIITDYPDSASVFLSDEM